MRHDPGLAASPPVRYRLKVEEYVFFFPGLVLASLSAGADVTAGRTGFPDLAGCPIRSRR